VSESVQKAIRANNGEIFKQEPSRTRRKGKQADRPLFRPTKLEATIAFVAQMALLVVIVPLFIALILISFHCLKIAIQIYKG
jgi:hypothetical protein